MRKRSATEWMMIAMLALFVMGGIANRIAEAYPATAGITLTPLGGFIAYKQIVHTVSGALLTVCLTVFAYFAYRNIAVSERR